MTRKTVRQVVSLLLVSDSDIWQTVKTLMKCGISSVSTLFVKTKTQRNTFSFFFLKIRGQKYYNIALVLQD